MHIYFSGIGGAGIGPLALIAHQAGYEVSGSDVKQSSYIEYLRDHGLTDIFIGQDGSQIKAAHAAKSIDWFVYSSALPKTDPNHPELVFCRENDIRSSKRDEFLNLLLKDRGLEMLAVAGTHGKSTTTAMAVWAMKQLGQPVSYSVGAKLSFGEMGEFNPESKYFVYEADEYDHNFLSFYPKYSVIAGIDWDHPDIYPTRESYLAAFNEFITQSANTTLWLDDAEQLALQSAPSLEILDQNDPTIDSELTLAGRVNRQNAWLVIKTLSRVTGANEKSLVDIMNGFPGLSRRFEKIVENVYSDYAHTPPKIRGALQLAQEIAGDNVVVVYEGLHNTRQHFIKDELAGLFNGVKKLYVVPSYLAREDKDLALLSPEDIVGLLSKNAAEHAQAAELNEQLSSAIARHAKEGDIVLCLSAGGAGSLDEWLRKEF